MRTVFNIEIKTDVPAHDKARREAYIKLMTIAARTLYTQATMLAKGVSIDVVLSSDGENGSEEHPLFEPALKQE
jgi:hypothetical protein